jgi:FkbM family methyltransferase
MNNEMLRSVAGKAKRSLANRRRYTRTRDWLKSLYNRVLQRKWARHFPAWGHFATIYLKGISDPFYLRLGSTDWLVLEEIYFHGEYDSLSQLDLTDVRTIIDLGANVGLSVRLWRRKYPDAIVLAVEPDPENMSALHRNHGADPKIMTVQACIGASEGIVRLDRSGGAWGVRMANGSTQDSGIEVQSLPLSEILRQQKIDGPIDLLKCDIEGAEAEVFANCADWINRVRAVVLEIHAPYTLDRWREDTRAAGAKLEIISTNKSSTDTMVVLAAGHRSR